MNKMDEIIIVAPRNIVFNDEQLVFQGTEQNSEKVQEIFDNISNSCSTMRRGNAEEDESYKQPIPYAIIRRDDEIFVYERLQGGGEQKLHNKLSLGVGGHMNDSKEDLPFPELLSSNLLREIEEELDIDSEHKPELKILGLINDDFDKEEVGKFHIGILASLDVHTETVVTVRETEELAGRFVPISILKAEGTYNRLESWSKIVVDIL